MVHGEVVTQYSFHPSPSWLTPQPPVAALPRESGLEQAEHNNDVPFLLLHYHKTGNNVAM